MMSRRPRGPSTRRQVTLLGTGQRVQEPNLAALVGSTGQKPSKYGNRATYVDGRRFASRREAERYQTLQLMEQAGKIRALECQVRYPFDINGVRVAVYVADFVYADAKTGEVIVEDSKGFRTREYILKAKLLLALYGHRVQEV